MKKVKYILFLLIIFTSKSYTNEIIATVSARNFVLVRDTLFFDIFLEKNTDNWTAFANTTLQLEFLDSVLVDSTDYIFTFMDTTAIPNLAVTVGNQLSVDGYLIEPKVFDGRFSLTIIGPENYDECLLFEKGDEKLLGRFAIISTKGSGVPLYLKWKEPHDWYQALAYKTNRDSLLNGSVPFYYVNDNIEMDDGNQFTFQLNIDQNPEEYFDFEDFWVIYTGQMIDSLGWSIRLEKDVNGYFIKRGVRTSIFEVEFTDLVGTWVVNDPKYNPRYVSRGYSKTRQVYFPFYDTVQYRGGEYCYSLWANMNRKDGTSFDTLLAQRCINVPNAVISEANPLTNPFSYKTTILLDLDDDCYVDGFVVDELGKFVTQLTWKGTPMEKLPMKIGDDYEIPFVADKVASQGLYNAIFIAYPINDKNIELSRASVKLQLVKDGNK